MQLYDAGRVPNCQRTRIFLAEKGVHVPLVPVDLAARDHKTDAFGRLNPRKRVPVLVLDDGTVITESIAICRYFEELQPDPPLFGTGALERALVEMWQRRLEFELLGAIAAVFRHGRRSMADLEVPQVPEWAEANKPKVMEFLGFLDAHLADRSYVCGEIFTVTDITGFVALGFMNWARLELPPDLRHVARWHATVSARPSASA
jgi:glutathione S-transferase